jgi:Acetyltransferases, including N-acetylases of ribosomal proteins
LNISLRPTVVSDLETLFQFQLDPDAAYLAAFMPENYTDKAAFMKKFTGLLQNPDINNQTILQVNTIVGSIASFTIHGDREITYWIDRAHWSKGIGSKALEQFLVIETNRPLLARVAFDNYGSQKVLERSGFLRAGTDKGFASARQAEIEEYIYKLD